MLSPDPNDAAGPPVTPDAVTPDAAQRAVVEGDPLFSGVVVGAPGSGKTTALVERVRALVAGGMDPDAVLVLTPSRTSATALRDRLGVAIGRATSGAPARSLASFAFQIVRGADVHAGQEPPQLLTGADEDQILRDLLDGDAEDEAGGVSRWPDDVSTAMRATRGFRGDLRAFLAECTGLGVSPAQLRALADAEDLPIWSAIAGFLEEYTAVRVAMRSSHRDAAGLLAEATMHVGEASDAALGRFAGVRVILVDDAQELTAGGIDLLEACRRRGIAVTAFGDPDVGSGVFRGAAPELFARLVRVLGGPMVLDGTHRGAGDVAAVVRAVTARIGAAGVVAHRRAPGPVPAASASVQTVVLRSPGEQTDAIARILRERRLRDGVAWSQCAVIAHDTRQVGALVAELAARDVPTRASGPGAALGAQRVVRDLLHLVDVALRDTAEWSSDDVADLLLGRFGGFDPVELRRLRSALRLRDLAAGDRDAPPDGAAAGDPMLSALQHPAELALVDSRESRRAQRVAGAIARVRAAAAADGSAHELLWAAWQASGLERVWHEASRGHGMSAEQAGRDLDALVALFQAAKRFGERRPGEPASTFLRGVGDSDVADDRLEAEAAVEAVAVMTPAAALGTEFDTVVVAGVQEGVWPNLRPRGGILQTARLIERVQHPDLPPTGTLDRRRTAMHDELRLFARAVSRADARLVVTAVDDDDTGPSIFFEMLPDPVPVESVPAHPLTLRGLVAQHRRALTTAPESDAGRRAAEQLAVLAEARVPGAHPSQWFGVAPPTSTEPMRDSALGVRVSPSRISTLEECALNWAISDLGGDRASTTAGIGTVIHAALENADGIDEDSLWREVESRWGELEFEAAWRERAERTRARDMVRRLSLYLRRFAASGGRLAEAEGRFEVEVPPRRDGAPAVRLSGAIDRVEVQGDGTVVIVDLKTGKSEPQTDAKVRENPQLAAYQLAFDGGAVPSVAGLPSAGAKLLVLRPTSTKHDYAEPTQAPFDDEARGSFTARVHDAVDTMCGTAFAGPVEEHCRGDHTYGQCRIHTVAAVSAP